MIYSTSFGQEKQIIRETFESNKFQWDEFYEKNRSSNIQDGALVIKNEDNITTISVVEFPLNTEQNFKIHFKFISKINSDNWFGIVYNYEDEDNYSCFLMQEQKFKIINKVDGTQRISRQGSIILYSAKKEKEINAVMEKKGQKLIFSVDNMEVITITKPLSYPAFGCCLQGEATLKVDEIIMEQQLQDE